VTERKKMAGDAMMMEGAYSPNKPQAQFRFSVINVISSLSHLWRRP